MKITQFSVSDFQMLTAISVTPSAPVLLFAGQNEQGKSSLHDAIRMAMTGESSRVKLKKDYDQLVRDGAKTGYIHIEMADQRTASVDLPAGKITYTAGAQESTDQDAADIQRASLPLVIDPHKFAALPENDRRAFLFKLAALKCDGQAVSQRMLARGCDEKKVQETTPMLRGGFSAAHDYAKEKAKAAKAMWKGVTGETYGDKKAETWRADAPAIDPLHKTAAQNDLARIEQQLETALLEQGDLLSKSDTAVNRRRQKANLEETAAKRGKIQAKLNFDRSELAAWEARVADVKAQASAVKAAPLACPHCSGLLQMTHGVLVEYQAPDIAADAELVAKLPEYERALALVKSAVAHDERDLKAVEDAEAALKSMAESAIEEPAENAVAEKAAQVAALKVRRKEVQAELDAIVARKIQAEHAQQKTEQAKKHHEDAKGWETLADALAPDGIPSEMLADALAPFNSRLRDTSIATGWGQVQIDADMTIRIAGRLYSLASESAMWRADAAIAEAISHCSGLKFACFDRVDCLDLANRSAFFKWMHRLATDNAVDTAVCFGTFKALPGLPATSFDARWIERGAIQQPIKEAA